MDSFSSRFICLRMRTLSISHEGHFTCRACLEEQQGLQQLLGGDQGLVLGVMLHHLVGPSRTRQGAGYFDLGGVVAHEHRGAPNLGALPAVAHEGLAVANVQHSSGLLIR